MASYVEGVQVHGKWYNYRKVFVGQVKASVKSADIEAYARDFEHLEPAQVHVVPQRQDCGSFCYHA